MTDDQETDKKDLEVLKQKIQNSKIAYERSAGATENESDMTFEWSAVSATKPNPGLKKPEERFYTSQPKIEFSG